VREVSRYTKAARQKVLAQNAMAKLTGNTIVPLGQKQSVPPKNHKEIQRDEEGHGGLGRNRTTCDFQSQSVEVISKS
jgi:hypothetical protein